MNTAKLNFGKPYWYGTFGQMATESLLRQKSAQYPRYYTANDFGLQFDKRVHDCVGLIKGYLWSDTPTSSPIYNESQDKNVSGMLDNCTKKGDMSTMPDIIGVLVFMEGHVGIYIGNGKVIEARGHAYGVVETNLVGRGWTKWGKLDWITYVGDEEMTEEDAKKIIQQKTGFDDNTMFWLSRYIYHEDLFIKWANSYIK